MSVESAVENQALLGDRPSVEASAAWSELFGQIHPLDRSIAGTWQRCYEGKFDIALKLKPRRICEIGVRAGYSAFMFLRACPDAFLLGIDNDSNTHGGVAGLVNHARELLHKENRDFALLLYDSQRLDRLPGAFDLVHVDGDHSYQGTFHDLRLGWMSSPAVLVDDYGLIPDVRRAVDDFCTERAAHLELIDDKQVLLTRPGFPFTSHVALAVDGHETLAGANYALRFVDYPDRPATPVLYFQGRRVIKSWTLEMFHLEPADPWGCSG